MKFVVKNTQWSTHSKAQICASIFRMTDHVAMSQSNIHIIEICFIRVTNLNVMKNYRAVDTRLDRKLGNFLQIPI